jgi:hypothetical protein
MRLLRERDIEAYLVERVKARGGVAYKFVSPGRRGVPDRLVMLPGGVLLFVELKAPGKKAEAHQLREHKRLRDMGQKVVVVDSLESVDGLLA